MPKASKKRVSRKKVVRETQVSPKMSEQMNAMLVVFAVAMMLLAYLLVKLYAR